jgi:membrane associated rhomboid family serine protease
MGVVLILEIYTLSTSQKAFQDLFVAQAALTPALIFAPLAHATLFSHFLVNLGLFLMFGWPTEGMLERKEFVMFTFLAAYLPTYLQVLYSNLTTSQAGTLGFSGAVYAYPPLYAMLSIKGRESDLPVASLGIRTAAIVLCLVIPFSIVGLMPFLPSGLPGAKVTHSAGFAIGCLYGIWKCQNRWG